MGSLETRTEEMHKPIATKLRSPKTILSSDKNITQELTDTVPLLTTTTSNTPHSKRRISSKYSHLPVHPTTTTSTETTSSADLQQQLYFKMKRSFQDRANDPALHDDHQEDDAPPEGEKRVKRHKTSKSSKSASGSSSKHSAKDSTAYVSKQQQQQEWDAWVEETVIDEDEVISEDETPELIIENVDKRVPTIYDYARMKAIMNDALSNQFKNAKEYVYHLEQTKNFMKNQIVWESRQEDIRRPVPRPLAFFGPQRNPNEPLRYLYNKDLFFLKYGNTEENKHILSLYKIHAERFLEVDLEEKMNR
ncbi:hypothetical protein Tco_0897033 [Tanacetum coccineum]